MSASLSRAIPAENTRKPVGLNRGMAHRVKVCES